ncbi:hypothetical protein [Mucilaginibacter ginkgonis]|uniref:Uncharacterized protein n=1 Tax=Mucilaginibacter ginkgonis TaxID=2682091 RepID=A0A6I4IPG7_9SPHI|nr:hypothetical protein [Mucilaginibacter ginkgonis]QQL49211.1 hypothetical protein GO620_013640 [Mucilaginibacter ginkgonis]
MERFNITITHKKQVLDFEVADYLHHTDEHCKFEIYANGEFVASLEPDRHKHLYVCKDAGIVKPEILNLLADKLEALPQPNWKLSLQ